jgi:hypothetical protein
VMSATFDLTRGKCVEEEEKLVLYAIGRCAPRFHFLSGLKRIVELLTAPWPLATGEEQNLSRCRGEVQATQIGRDGSLWGVGSRCRNDGARGLNCPIAA